MKVKKKNRIIISICCAFIALVSVFSIFNVSKQTFARSFDEFYSYNSSEFNIKVTNYHSFTKNIFNVDYYDEFTSSSGNGKYVGFSVPLHVGTVYTISFFKPIGWLKISNSATGYNSVETYSPDNDIYNFTFTMQRNVNIPSGVPQYVFLGDSDYNIYSIDYIISASVQVELGSEFTSFEPFKSNDFISFSSILNTGIDRDTSTWLFEQVIFNNLSCNSIPYYMGTAITDNTFENTIFYNSRNNKFNFMYREFFEYDGKINEYNSFELLVNYDYIESDSYDSSTYFNSSVQRIVFGSYLNWGGYKSSNVREQPSDYFSVFEKFNFISFVDVNGNNLNIYFPLISDDINDYFQFTTYFINSDATQDYSNGFTAGKAEGFSEGQSKGYTDGYGVGYIDGKNNGFQLGYEEALVGTNKYSFNGLLTAVIDVPVKTFTSLFNFEILGVNLSGFFLGLLTISIIITVVRFMLGG